jgi:hypothetical protein
MRTKKYRRGFLQKKIPSPSALLLLPLTMEREGRGRPTRRGRGRPAGHWAWSRSGAGGACRRAQASVQAIAVAGEGEGRWRRRRGEVREGRGGLHGRENRKHEETLGATMVEAHRRRPRRSQAQIHRLRTNCRSDRWIEDTGTKLLTRRTQRYPRIPPTTHG